MKALFLIFALLLVMPVGAAELYVAAGQTIWSKCGKQPGCWDHQPLADAPAWDLRGRAMKVGLRMADLEAAIVNLGEASVTGWYMPDDHYDQGMMHCRGHWHSRCSPSTVNVTTVQRTYGVSVAYAPRLTSGHLSLTPTIGLLAYEQRQWFIYRWREGDAYASVNSTGHVTPFAGVRLGYHVGRLSLGAGAEWYLRPRYRDSPAGGGEDSRIGLRLHLLDVRFAL